VPSNLEGTFEREEFAANATLTGSIYILAIGSQNFNEFALAIKSSVFLGFLSLVPCRLLSFCGLGFS